MTGIRDAFYTIKERLELIYGYYVQNTKWTECETELADVKVLIKKFEEVLSCYEKANGKKIFVRLSRKEVALHEELTTQYYRVIHAVEQKNGQAFGEAIQRFSTFCGHVWPQLPK